MVGCGFSSLRWSGYNIAAQTAARLGQTSERKEVMKMANEKSPSRRPSGSRTPAKTKAPSRTPLPRGVLKKTFTSASTANDALTFTNLDLSGGKKQAAATGSSKSNASKQ